LTKEAVFTIIRGKFWMFYIFMGLTLSWTLYRSQIKSFFHHWSCSTRRLSVQWKIFGNVMGLLVLVTNHLTAVIQGAIQLKDLIQLLWVALQSRKSLFS